MIIYVKGQISTIIGGCYDNAIVLGCYLKRSRKSYIFIITQFARVRFIRNSTTIHSIQFWIKCWVYSISCFEDREELGAELERFAGEGDAVLFKASNSMKLFELADRMGGNAK